MAVFEVLYQVGSVSPFHLKSLMAQSAYWFLQIYY